jgi:hypothetical protein
LRGEPIIPKIFFKPSPQRFISDYRPLKIFLTALGVFHYSNWGEAPKFLRGYRANAFDFGVA